MVSRPRGHGAGTKSNYECAVYVDSLKEMANAEIEKQLL